MSHALRPLLLIAAIALGMPAHAQDQGSEPASERESAGDRVRQVERDGGRVLQAEPMQRSGREVYRLKVLTPEGRVRVLDDSRRRETRTERAEDPRSGRSERNSDRSRASERNTRRASPPERSESQQDDGDDGRRSRRRD